MTDWQNIVVIAVAVVFGLFLLWRVRPGTGARSVRKVARDAIQARARARAASNPRDRARALCEAADVFADQPSGLWPAVGFYLRALRADPTWTEPVDRLRALLFRRRPRALERILWRRMSVIPWNADTRPVVASLAGTLSDLYRTRIRSRARAVVLSRLAKELQPPSSA
jgi:hypothetical protein